MFEPAHLLIPNLHDLQIYQSLPFIPVKILKHIHIKK